MSFKWLIGALAFLAVVGAIFIGGVIVGGSWGSGMAEEDHAGQLEQIEQCLPIQDEAQLQECLTTETGAGS